jgi:RNA 3'-terminal phosphate cyclase (ATP)
MGCRAEVSEVEPGFYPKGGGRITVSVTGGGLEPLALTEPEGERRLRALSIATADLAKARVPERQLEGACERAEFDEAVFHYVASPSTGTAVLLTAEHENCRLGASSLGERGKPAEKVGREAWRALERAMRSGACLDEHMADQVLPYLALAGGESRVRVAGITDHCRTNAYVIEQFLPVRFELDAEEGLISCAPR